MQLVKSIQAICLEIGLLSLMHVLMTRLVNRIANRDGDAVISSCASRDGQIAMILALRLVILAYFELYQDTLLSLQLRSVLARAFSIVYDFLPFFL